MSEQGKTTNAIEMAKAAGVAPKKFREALRDADLSWHSHNDRWTVDWGSTEHEEMRKVLHRMTGAISA